MAMFMNAYPENKKMEEWLAKNEDERAQIAEQNGWSWCGLWGDIGNILRDQYNQADKSPQVRNKYGGYDGWYKEPKTGEEYAPCTNKECPYYDTITWGENKYKGANCSYWGDTDRMFECGDELFVLIQQWIDVCGIEALDQLQKEWNIHPDIIGWFKEGDEYFKNKESDKMNMNKEAINEIWKLTEEVQDVVDLVSNMGIYYHSDAWTAVHPVNHMCSNILTWKRKDFEDIDVSNVDSFNVGGSMSHTQYFYKNDWESDPRELAEAKANTIKYYLDEIVKNFKAEYFKIGVYAERPYRDAGWECPIGINATLIKPKCLEYAHLDQLVQQIANEEGSVIEDPWVDYDKNNPDDGIKYYAMVGFHSVTLINDEKDEYQGDYGVNGKYIKDAADLIRKIENNAEELRIKYADKGVKVSIGDFNVGCEYGMSIYVWIPYQIQH